MFGTAWYQLTHSTYEVGGKRDTVVSWFGNCSYRKLRVTKVVRRSFCPLCHCELGDIQYVGLNRDQFFGEKKGFADLVEDGVVVWVVKVKRSAVARGCRITEDDYFHFPSKVALIDKVFPKRCWGAKWSLGSRGGVDGS